MAQLKPGKVLFGVPDEFDLTGLKYEELELIQSALISFKQHDLTDAETFKNERRMCSEIYAAIDKEVIKLKEQDLSQLKSGQNIQPAKY